MNLTLKTLFPLALGALVAAAPRTSSAEDKTSSWRGAVEIAGNRSVPIEQRIEALTELGYDYSPNDKQALRSDAKFLDGLIAVSGNRAPAEGESSEEQLAELRARAISGLAKLFSTYNGKAGDYAQDARQKVTAAVVDAIVNDPSAEVRGAAARGLLYFGMDMNMEQLGKLIKSMNPQHIPDHHQRYEIARYLSRQKMSDLTDEEVQALVDALDPKKEPHDAHRMEVASAIGNSRLDDPRLVAALIASAEKSTGKTSNDWERRFMVLGLAGTGDTSAPAIGLYSRLLDEKHEQDPFVRQAALAGVLCLKGDAACYLAKRQLREMEDKERIWLERQRYNPYSTPIQALKKRLESGEPTELPGDVSALPGRIFYSNK